MRFTVDVECSPEEARRFIGLPDVTPLNERLVQEMTKRIEQNMALMSPDTMVSSWMAVGTQAQDAFLKLMTTGTAAAFGAGDKR